MLEEGLVHGAHHIADEQQTGAPIRSTKRRRHTPVIKDHYSIENVRPVQLDDKYISFAKSGLEQGDRDSSVRV